MSQHTDNSIVIDAPLELAWSMANDVESWPTLFEGEYAGAEVLERDDGRIRFRLTTVPIKGRSFSWVSERVLDEERHTVTARRIELGPFRYMHIFQSLEPGQNGVRLRWVQDFEVLPGASFTDQQMGERVNLNSRLQLERHKLLIEEAARRAAAG